MTSDQVSKHAQNIIAAYKVEVKLIEFSTCISVT